MYFRGRRNLSAKIEIDFGMRNSKGVRIAV